MPVKSDASMTIRVNKKVKQKAQQIFSDLGMDMSTAINVFLRQAIYYNGFPFALRNPVVESDENDDVDDATKNNSSN